MVNTDKFIEQAVEEIKEEIDEKKAIIALSGGVDSSVCAELAYRAIGDRLTAVYVDTGLMRKGETKAVKEVFKHMENFKIIEAKDRFLGALKGVTDPEEKRKIIGEKFMRIFEEVAEETGADYCIQGTIYPDRIESEGEIKSHHNVGGLPEILEFERIIEPVRDLYKDDVREVAKALDLSDEIVNRMPFPGPGLSVRMTGEVTEEKLKVVKESNAIVEEEIEDENIWQAFAAIIGKGTGVKGDNRVHGWIIAIRAVQSRDAMTAKAVNINWSKLQEIQSRITGKLPNVSRVVYDITHKPPATIEYE